MDNNTNKGDKVNNLKLVLKYTATVAAFALTSGGIIYLIDKPLKGLTNLQSAELMAVSVAIALPICFVVIGVIAEIDERRSRR